MFSCQINTTVVDYTDFFKMEFTSTKFIFYCHSKLFFLSKEELMRNTDSVIWGFSGGTTTPEIDETQK